MMAFGEYIIPVGGLAVGEHEYDYVVDNEFFNSIGYSEVEEGKVNVHVALSKESKAMTFAFAFEGEVKVACDRCGDDYMQKIEGEQVLYLKYGTEYCEESDDVIVIPTDQREFDIHTLVYEYIMLALPIRCVHPDDENGNSTCNPEAIEVLNRIQAGNSVDPRWKALENLKNED